jgi:(2Fe-2S) ferredoxin
MIDLNTSPSGPEPPARAVVLLAKSAFAAAPMQEMQRLAQRIQRRRGPREHVSFAFSEQGTPALRDVMLSLRDGGFDEIVVVPLLIPLEPSFQNWLGRTLQRWLREDPGGWPDIRISAPPEEAPGLDDLIGALIDAGSTRPAVAPPDRPLPDASLVPAQKRRVLVCQGGPCNAAGADVIWGHLRNEQERRKLRTLGDGVMTAKSTCLGPCNLAPVLQVFPEGTYYGGVTETGIDRIIDDHLLGGRVVAALAYEPTGRKQSLRHGSLPFKRQSS